MSSEDKLYWLIEDYLSGNLKGEALASFKEELAADSSLANKVQLHQIANDLVIERRLTDVKTILQDQRSNAGKPWKAILGISTALLLLSGSLYLWIGNENSEKTVSDTILETNKKDKTASSQNSEAEKTPNSYSTKKVTSKENFNKPETTEENSGSSPTASSTIEEQSKEVYSTKQDEQHYALTPATSTVVDPCTKAHIFATVHPIAACQGDNNGAIQITELKGDYPPLHYSLQDKHGDTYNNTLNLHTGLYSVKITDSKGCTKEINNIEVPAKICEKDYDFNPFTGGTWSIPVSSQAGILHIYDQSNTLVFEKEIRAEAEEQWDGTSRTGEINTGYYIFVINYKDGSVKKGSVTIVR